MIAMNFMPNVLLFLCLAAAAGACLGALVDDLRRPDLGADETTGVYAHLRSVQGRTIFARGSNVPGRVRADSSYRLSRARAWATVESNTSVLAFRASAGADMHPALTG